MRKWLFLLGFVLTLFLSLGNLDALASVHHYPLGSDRVMYRSLQTLRENPIDSPEHQDHAWQVVLFKQIKAGQVELFHVRLVGFPGLEKLEHPHPLKLTTSTGQTWTAEEVPVPFTSNIGEYDMFAFMAELDSNLSLRLELPVKEHRIELVVPPFVVQEWRRIKDLSNS